MYTSFNREVVNNTEPSTKYTEYLKSFEDTIYNGDGRERSNHHRSSRRNTQQPLQELPNNEVKFSNIFSPTESNALKLQLMQKTASLPLLEQDNNNNYNGALRGATSVNEVDARGPRRRSTARNSVHANNGGRKGESVANILYSTIRHGHEYDNPSADETLHTGSDSKVDYDPHEPLPAVDQIALRHELLSNIRAISRATYFEDLYTGKARRNSMSPETEILRLLENPLAAAASAGGRNARIIPSKETSLSRVDRWVKESSEASSRNQDTDDEKGADVKQNTSLYHQSLWKEEQKGKREAAKQIKNIKGGSEGTTTESSYATESDPEAESATTFERQTSDFKTTKYLDSNSNGSRSDRNFGAIKEKGSTVIIPKVGKATNISLRAAETPSHYSQSKYLGSHLDPDVDSHGKRRPFSFGVASSNDIPLSVSLPNVAQNSYRSTPVAMHDTYSIKSYSTSRPENLNYLTTTLPTKPGNVKGKKREINNNNGEQVRRVQQKPVLGDGQRHGLPKNGQRRGVITRPQKLDKVPGIYARLNMNQVVLKKVWFYVNGDEFYPRFECRFREGKDIRDMDQLLDLLTKRFPILPTGARFIFTMDGYLINSLDEILNENSYVVSSTRKFKALKYGNGGHEGDTNKKFALKSTNPKAHHQPLHKQLSSSDGNLNSRGGRRGLTHSQLEHNSSSSLHSKSVSVSDVPKLVAHVIEEAAESSSATRHPVRVINGLRPSLQSQVLLNTKTSQPFEDLVKDLAMSVRIPKQPIGNTLQTLAGRQIRSYSQLRSELKAGQRTFYVYTDLIGEEKVSMYSNNQTTHRDMRNSRNRNTHGKPMVRAMLGKVDSNSSSDLSTTHEDQKRRKAQHIHKRSRSHAEYLHFRPDFRGTTSRSPSPRR